MAEARFTVFKEQDFNAAHFLREYQGGCERLHGHNYRVRVYAASDELDNAGLVVDFAALKAAMQEVLGRFDHRLLNEIPPFDSAPPSLERLAQHIAEEVAQRIDDARVRIAACQVWETERNCAIYRR
jgi:6-pyruvoyltetrahydropterin/6-carboxytetrahydropterin synthase